MSNKILILHPAFVRAREALLRALCTDMPGQLIFVIGLSGAGKSEIRYDAMQSFAKAPEHWGQGKLPVIALRAAASDRSSFSPKEFMTRFYTHRPKHPGDHMVNYMCLAEEIGITLVLFGVPRSSILWEGNAEICRRSRFVFVERYRLGSPADRENFERLAISLAQPYKFSRHDLPRRNLDLAYASSAGVCGELKSYLMRADDRRANDGAESITKAHLEDAVYSEAAMHTLHADAAQFDALRTPAGSSAIRRVLHGS